MSVIGHGVEIVTSGTRPASPFTGQMIYDDTTESFLWYTGSAWVGVTPAGTVNPYAGTSAPPGWLFCYGQTLDSTANPEYADLFTAIGTTYGGSGASSFIVPDFRGRAPFGKDDMGGSTANRVTDSGTDNSGINGAVLGASGGDQRSQQHTHVQNVHNHTQASHSHTVDNHNHTYALWRSSAYYGWYAQSGGPYNVATAQSYTGSTGNTSPGTNSQTPTINDTTATNQNTGTGTAQNMPPTIILNYIIKL